MTKQTYMHAILSWFLGLSLGFCLNAIAQQHEVASHHQSVDSNNPDFDFHRVEQIQILVEEAIAAGKMPGCVICFGTRDKMAYLQAFGDRQIHPERRAMETDTVFDLASLTKPIATATSVMKLVERGQIRLGQRVSEVLPEFGTHGKEAITIQQLLIHQSGLIPDNPLADYQHGPEVAWERICNLKLVAPVGSEFKYSDVNFIVLAEIVRRVSGRPLDQFCREEIFEPLRMQETGFVPETALQLRAAATEKRDGQWIQGEVHDPRAYLLNGVAGHAGLFSTAQDLARFAQTLLRDGTASTSEQSPSLLSAAAVRRMTKGHQVSSGLRGLGWDKQTGFSSNKGDLLSDSAYGHGGFTGTVLWIDPELDLFFVFLSNRVHPDGKGSVNHLAGNIANVIASSRKLSPEQTLHANATPVLTGLDVLLRDGPRDWGQRRVGLITNVTGRDHLGQSTAKVLAEHADVNLVALFSPEHGLEANLDIAKIADSTDSQTGLRVYSLYGETRRPTAAMLEEVDILVFDIQDIGTRFYTYISTMGEAMQAAARHGKKFVVLDRPNPLNGDILEGPLLDAGSQSFVGFHSLPLRHGMTVGELALMFRSELKLDLELEIITCENWDRAEYWDATGLTWVNPSPNMRSLTQALLYPGMGLWEMTNLSVGRGTDTPFEVIGAPWIDGRHWVQELRQAKVAGVVFVPIQFTPGSSKYANQLCGGVNVVVTQRAAFRSVDCGLALATSLRKLYPDKWAVKEINRLLGHQATATGLLEGTDWKSLAAEYEVDMRSFRERRNPFLLY